MTDNNHPCATCLRRYGCNGVDAERCPLINEEGEREEKIRLRNVMFDSGSSAVGLSEVVRRISYSGNCPETLCLPINGI